MLRGIVVAALTLAAGTVPAAAGAQTVNTQHPDVGRWSIQPSIGVLVDAYDMGDDGSSTGALAGLQVARRLSPSVSAVASLAYARVNDVGAHPLSSDEAHLIYRNEWIVAAAGPAVELAVRRATVALSLQAGAAWRRTPDARLVGVRPIPDPGVNSAPSPWLAPGSNDFSVTGALIPGAALRVPVASRVAVVGGASAYWTSFDEGGHVSPAFTFGLTFTP